MTKKQRKQKQSLESKIDTLIDIGRLTIYEPLREQIAKQINFYNSIYLTKYGEFYKIK